MILECNNFLKWQTAGTFWTTETINEGWNHCDRVTSKKYWRHKVRVSSLHRTCSLNAVWSCQLVLGCGITSLYSTVIASIILPPAPSWRGSSRLRENDDHIEKTSVAYTQPLRRKEQREMTEGAHLGREVSEYTAQESFALVFFLILMECSAPKEIFVSFTYLWLLDWISVRGWVARAAVRKYHPMGGLSNEMYPLAVWRPEVQDQAGAGWVPSLPTREGSGPGPSSCFWSSLDSRQFHPNHHPEVSLCMTVSQVSLAIRIPITLS